MTTKTLTFAGWRVELDTAEVIPHDPGAGTPAMVYSPDDLSGTYGCVMATGEIDGCEPVPSSVLAWLERIEEEVGAFLNW